MYVVITTKVRYAVGYSPPLLSGGHTVMGGFRYCKWLWFIYPINTTLLVGLYQTKTSKLAGGFAEPSRYCCVYLCMQLYEYIIVYNILCDIFDYIFIYKTLTVCCYNNEYTENNTPHSKNTSYNCFSSNYHRKLRRGLRS